MMLVCRPRVLSTATADVFFLILNMLTVYEGGYGYFSLRDEKIDAYWTSSTTALVRKYFYQQKQVVLFIHFGSATSYGAFELGQHRLT